jgi:hypothetical protein
MAKVIQGYSFPDDVTEEEAKAFIQKQKAASAPKDQPKKQEEMPAAEPPQEMGWGEYGAGLGKSALSGLTFNWSDEAIARARSAFPGGVPYEQALQEEREQIKKFQGQYPVTAFGSEIAGSIPTAFVPGLGGAKFIQGTARIAEAAKPLIQAGITGFKQGVIGGAGGSEGDATTAEGLKTMAQDSAVGGALGTAIGTGMTALGRAASPIIGRVQEWMKPQKYSEDVAKMKVLEDLKRSSLTPEQAQAKYEYMESTGATPSYFDVSPSLTSRAETIAQRPGASGEALTEDVIARQQGQRKRIMEQAKERLDVDKPYFDSVDDAVTALRTNADPLYKEAYKAKLSPETQYDLQGVMDRVNAAFPKAAKYAEQLYAADGKQFRGTGTEALYSNTFNGLPKLQQYDYIMRGLGQVLDKNTDVAGNITQIGGAAKKLRGEIAKILDDQVPEFAAARAQYKGDMEVKEALLGARKNFLRADPEELARDWAKMSVAEKEAYRAGALKSIRDSLFGSADYTDATKRIGQAVQDRREALNIIMPEKMSAKLFENYLEAEARIASNAQRIKSGSPTARRLEGAKDLESQPDMTALGVAGDVAKGKFGAAANRLFNTLVKNPAIPEARADAIGKILRSGTPEEVDRATKSLVAFVEEQQRREAARLLKERAVVGSAGRTAASRTAANRAPPPPEDDPYEMPPLTIRRGP